MLKNKLFAMPNFDGETTASAAPVATENTAVETAASATPTVSVLIDGKDINELTEAELLALGKDNVKQVVQIGRKALKVFTAQEWTAFKTTSKSVGAFVAKYGYQAVILGLLAWLAVK